MAIAAQSCIAGVCFIQLDANAPKFFGFSEFLAGLALMVLAWTIADVRYRFRVRTAPIPLQGISFSVVASGDPLTGKDETTEDHPIKADGTFGGRGQ